MNKSCIDISFLVRSPSTCLTGFQGGGGGVATDLAEQGKTSIGFFLDSFATAGPTGQIITLSTIPLKSVLLRGYISIKSDVLNCKNFLQGDHVSSQFPSFYVCMNLEDEVDDK